MLGGKGSVDRTGLERLLAAARAGDEAARGELFMQFRAMVRESAMRRLQAAGRTTYDPEDVASDVIARLIPEFAAIQDRAVESVLRFVFHLARCVLTDQYRFEHARKRDSRRTESESGDITSHAHQSFQEAEANEVRGQLKDSLPVGYAVLIDLKEEGYTHEEMGAFFGVSSRTIDRALRGLVAGSPAPDVVGDDQD